MPTPRLFKSAKGGGWVRAVEDPTYRGRSRDRPPRSAVTKWRHPNVQDLHHRFTAPIPPYRPLQPPDPAAPVENARITVSTPAGTILVPTDEVLWIEARQNYSLINRAGGGPLLVKRLLGDFGEELPSGRFARIGRSLVVNLRSLRTVSRLEGGGALLEFADTSETLVVGRAAMARLRQLLALQPPPESLPG